MGIYDRDHRKNDPWKKTPEGVKQYKISDFKKINSQEIKVKKPLNKWIYIILAICLILIVFFRSN